MGPPEDRRLGPEDARKIYTTPLLKFHDDFEAGPYHYGLIFERTDAPVSA
jgi:hypothetical protein